jgi:uncharacterized protein YuzE
MLAKRVPLHVTLDGEGDSAYVYLAERINAGEAVEQVVLDDDRVDGMVVLDLDANGRILGMEVVGASGLLPASLLQTMHRP